MNVSGDPADGIAVNRGDELSIDRSAQLFLPSALAAATVCRYTRAGNRYTLAASRPVRDGIDPLRDALNRAYRPPQPAWDEPLQYFRQPPCPHVPPANRALTVVLVADVTAARSEIRVYAAPPCSAVQNGLGVFAGIDPGLAGWLSTVGK